MATLQELERALIKADAAGAADDARALANEIRRMRGEQGPAKTTGAEPPADWAASEMSPVGRFAAGAGKAFVDTARGAGQMVGLVDDQKVADARERDAELMKTGAGVAGNVTGAVAQFLPTMFVPGANTYTGAALTGAAYNALQPVTGDESRLVNAGIGGALGAGGMAAGRALVAGGKGAAGLAQPFFKGGRQTIAGDTLRRFAGDKIDDVANALNTAPEYVPGSAPTTAQAGNNVGIARLEKALRQTSPDLGQSLDDIYVGQNAARVNALRGIAGTQDDLIAAIDARSKAAGPLYRAVSSADAPVDASRTAGLIERIIAKNPAREKLTGALSRIRGTLADADGNPVTSPQALKSASDNIADLIAETGPTGKKVNEAIVRELTTIKRSLDGQIAKAVPEYGQAMQTFRQMSGPIDEMKIGQQLLKKAASPVESMGGEPALYPTAYMRALNDPRSLVKSATGFARNKGLDALSPEARQTIEAVAKDLTRQASTQRLASAAGSDTAQNLATQNIVNRVLGPMGAGKYSDAAATRMFPATRVLNMIYSPADDMITQELAAAMTNPKYAAQLMNHAAPSRTVEEIAALLSRGGGVAPPVAYSAQQ